MNEILTYIESHTVDEVIKEMSEYLSYGQMSISSAVKLVQRKEELGFDVEDFIFTKCLKRFDLPCQNGYTAETGNVIVLIELSHTNRKAFKDLTSLVNNLKLVYGISDKYFKSLKCDQIRPLDQLHRELAEKVKTTTGLKFVIINTGHEHRTLEVVTVIPKKFKHELYDLLRPIEEKYDIGLSVRNYTVKELKQYYPEWYKEYLKQRKMTQ